MGIICGLLGRREMRIDASELHTLAATTQRYGTGVPQVLVSGHIGMGVQGYFSHARSVMDAAPFEDIFGNIVSFDGRLDNAKELCEMLGLDETKTSDSEVVLQAFLRWGEAGFARLTGDWALALWSQKDEKLLLARDHAGTRSLYFSQNECGVRWATYLDTLADSSKDSQISKEYAWAFLSGSLAHGLTPYAGIYSVQPGHYVVFANGVRREGTHWDPTVRTSIRYKSEGEYDAHFLSLFEMSVRRRTGAGAPILAQLSGGMDSTSIVCMSDFIRRKEGRDAELLDTISFFDDAEKSLDERRYFSITEAFRGKRGIHLDVAFSQRTFDVARCTLGVYHFPGCDSFSVRLEEKLYSDIWQGGYRVILSGIGGDEVLGGIPDERPELADYLVSGRLGALLTQGVAWSLPDRRPLVKVLLNTVSYAVRLYGQRPAIERGLPPWLPKDFCEGKASFKERNAVRGGRIGVAAHRLENGRAWWHILATCPHLNPQLYFRPEYRYPMQDKDLVEYLFSIPPDVILQPGRRRAMMRRALREIVPEEIVERPRKAFQLRAPLKALQQALPQLQKLFSDAKSIDVGVIDGPMFRSALEHVGVGSYQALLRAIAYELWLRTLPCFGQSATSTEKDLRVLAIP